MFYNSQCIIFILSYEFQDASTLSSSNTTMSDISSASICSEPLQYDVADGICIAELSHILEFSNCPPDPKGKVFVLRNEEATARQLIGVLNLLGASTECKKKLVPFMCLNLFGLCGWSGVSILPTTSQCEQIRDVICQDVWQISLQLGVALPDCELFSSEPVFCQTSGKFSKLTLFLPPYISDLILLYLIIPIHLELNFYKL